MGRDENGGAVVATNRRRLMREAKELSEPGVLKDGLIAAPLEDDLFEWHWTVKGPSGTEFEGGLYHGRLVLPSEYPLKPPELYVLTPSGRFETNTKVCLSISSFHPETWQPSWGIRTALVALTAFFGSDPMGAVGSLNAPVGERKRLARASKEFRCDKCGYEASECPLVESIPISASGSVAAASTMSEAERTQGDDEGDRGYARHADETHAFFAPSTASTTAQPPDTAGAHHRSQALSVVHSSISPPNRGANAHASDLASSATGSASTRRRATSNDHRRQGTAGPQQQRNEAAPSNATVPLGDEQGRVVSRAAVVDTSLPGGDPLWTDRAILVVLLALVACVVRKIA